MELANAKEQNNKVVGVVTQEERDEIKRLYERKNGLLELLKIIPDIDDKEKADKLYDKLVQDMAGTTSEYNGWFSAMSKKYEWENVPGYNWQINFETREVFLMK